MRADRAHSQRRPENAGPGPQQAYLRHGPARFSGVVGLRGGCFHGPAGRFAEIRGARKNVLDHQELIIDPSTMESPIPVTLKAISRAALMALALLACQQSISAEAPKYESESVRQARVHHILFINASDADSAYQALGATPAARQFEAFKSMARLQSKDPGSAPAGGDLGMVVEGEMVKEFEGAVFRQEPFTVSAPFKSAFGWHLTHVTKKSEKPVAAICKESLAATIAREPPSKTTALRFSANARSPEDLHPDVLLHIGDGWSGPLTDGNGDLATCAKWPSPAMPTSSMWTFTSNTSVRSTTRNPRHAGARCARGFK